MIEAAAKLSPWLSSREVVARVARHLGCTLEVADRRIDDVGRGGRIQARGVVAGQPVLVLPADWNGRVDLAGTTMKPPEGAEITNLELCYIDLIAAGLLPPPAEKAWWPAAEANAYLVKGIPLPWAAWQQAGAAPAEIEQAAKELARLIGEDRVPAQGRRSPQGPMEQIPGSDFRIPGFTWVIRPDGDLGTSPPGRLAVFLGAPRGPAEPERRCWYGIEVEAAELRQARPRPTAPELAKAEPTRWQRDRTINAIKSFYPPAGIRPKDVSIAALTQRINKLSEFEGGEVSEDTVGRADREIKAPRKK